MDGNQKLTLGLVWTIILHYQVGALTKHDTHKLLPTFAPFPLTSHSLEWLLAVACALLPAALPNKYTVGERVSVNTPLSQEVDDDSRKRVTLSSTKALCVGTDCAQYAQGHMQERKRSVTCIKSVRELYHALTLPSLVACCKEWCSCVYCYIYHYCRHFVKCILDHIKYLFVKQKIES